MPPLIYRTVIILCFCTMIFSFAILTRNGYLHLGFLPPTAGFLFLVWWITKYAR